MKSNWNVFIGVCVGAVLGFAVGQHLGAKAPLGTPINRADARPGNAAPGADQIYQVALGNSPQKGPDDAKVTIVEWSDFQCPFCGRVMPTLDQIEKAYGSDVRVVFKQNPLPMHPNAPYAAKAALAAQKQGKFWEMHDKLFAANNAHTPDGLAKDKVDQMARDVGLNMSQFDTDAASPEIAATITADQAQASMLGANGTPHFFVNGVRLSGAMPFDSFKTVIDAQLKRASQLLSSGVSRKQLYEELTKDGLTHQAAAPPQQQQRPPAPQAKNVDPGDGPAMGGKHPKVTIVEWSDFQCPFCSRVEPTLKQIMDTYKDDVRLVWRNEPLPFHPNATPAAKAAMAAARQGQDKFWKMHDLMYAHQQDLSDAKYEEWAKEIGLNLAKWKTDKESPEIAAGINKDATYGQSVGADGTPAFFVNGKFISGAMPFESFKPVIDEQIKKADELLKKGIQQDQLYKTLMEENVKSAGAAPGAPAANNDAPVNVEVGAAPVLGSKTAQVTIVEFSDFQCPYCGRVEPALKQIRDEYKGKVKIAWKNQPLTFHPNAMPAAEAAMAANEQGKFWEMHDKLFENQQTLSPAVYDSIAKEIGLDLNKFHASIETHRNQAGIQADMAIGSAIGASGTPTFFINGHKLVGAMPFESFKQVIDAELASKVAHK